MIAKWMSGAYFVKVFSLIVVLSIHFGLCAEAHAQDDVWVSAYYAGWMQGGWNEGYLSADEIDFDAVTHIIHFSIMPNRDGSPVLGLSIS